MSLLRWRVEVDRGVVLRRQDVAPSSRLSLVYPRSPSARISWGTSNLYTPINSSGWWLPRTCAPFTQRAARIWPYNWMHRVHAGLPLPYRLSWTNSRQAIYPSPPPSLSSSHLPTLYHSLASPPRGPVWCNARGWNGGMGTWHTVSSPATTLLIDRVINDCVYQLSLSVYSPLIYYLFTRERVCVSARERLKNLSRSRGRFCDTPRLSLPIVPAPICCRMYELLPWW